MNAKVKILVSTDGAHQPQLATQSALEEPPESLDCIHRESPELRYCDFPSTVNERRPHSPRLARRPLASGLIIPFLPRQRVIGAYSGKPDPSRLFAALRYITDGSFIDPVARRLPGSHLTGEVNRGVIQTNQSSAH